MSDYRAFLAPPSSGRPTTPIVPRERVRPGEPLKAPAPIRLPPTPSVGKIINAVAREHGVTRDDILSRDRALKVYIARRAAMAAVSVAYPKKTRKWIGDKFGRDPRNVSRALRGARELGIKTSLSEAERLAGRPSALSIIRDEAEKHGLTSKDILGPSKTAKVLAARRSALAAVLEVYPKAKSTWLAKKFRRDHTTILYALGRLPSKGGPA